MGGHHMKFGDITKHLSGKQQLKEAKTNEDLDKPRTSDQVLLTDGQLGSVAGGGKAGHVEKKARTIEDQDKPRTSDKVLLTDDQLGSVAGGAAGKAEKASHTVIK